MKYQILITALFYVLANLALYLSLNFNVLFFYILINMFILIFNLLIFRIKKLEAKLKMIYPNQFNEIINETAEDHPIIKSARKRLGK